MWLTYARAPQRSQERLRLAEDLGKITSNTFHGALRGTSATFLLGATFLESVPLVTPVSITDARFGRV
jgi:hypothetical protein